MNDHAKNTNDSSVDASSSDSTPSDNMSFSDLYRPVAPALLAWAHARMPVSLLGRMEPHDLVQEVVLRTYERFAQFDPSRSTFRTWMFGIGRNVMLELLRIHIGTKKSNEFGRIDKGYDLGDIPAETTTISRKAAKNEYLLEFIEKIKSLNDQDRELVTIRGLEGRSHEDVAQAMGMSLSATQKKWQRLLDQLNDGSLPTGLFL